MYKSYILYIVYTNFDGLFCTQNKFFYRNLWIFTTFIRIEFSNFVHVIQLQTSKSWIVQPVRFIFFCTGAKNHVGRYICQKLCKRLCKVLQILIWLWVWQLESHFQIFKKERKPKDENNFSIGQVCVFSFLWFGLLF